MYNFVWYYVYDFSGIVWNKPTYVCTQWSRQIFLDRYGAHFQCKKAQFYAYLMKSSKLHVH